MIPTVSIITPTYNRAHLLPQLWKSLTQQSEHDFQWVIVDDGSIDNTRQVVENFFDPRIRYIWQNNNGVNSARNLGEKFIKAEYVIYLDSDDELFNENTLKDMLSEIRAARSEIASVEFTVINNQGKTGLYHLPADRIEANYVNIVCGQKIWGEFFSIYRRDAIGIAAWPPYNGLEALRHWQIVKRRPVLLVNRPALICNSGREDNLTSEHSCVRRAKSMAAGIEELIFDHQSAWLQYCPCQLGKHRFYRGMYLALSTVGFRAIPDLIMAIRFGKAVIRTKAFFLLGALILPIRVRQYFFVKRPNLIKMLISNVIHKLK